MDGQDPSTLKEKSKLELLQDEFDLEVASLPAALQSTDPAQFLDYLVSIFGEEDHLPCARMLTDNGKESSMGMQTFAAALSQPLSLEGQEPLLQMKETYRTIENELELIQKNSLPPRSAKCKLHPGDNGVGKLNLVICNACNRTLLAHSFANHLTACSGQSHLPSPAPSRASAKLELSRLKKQTQDAKGKFARGPRGSQGGPRKKSRLSASTSDSKTAMLELGDLPVPKIPEPIGAAKGMLSHSDLAAEDLFLLGPQRPRSQISRKKRRVEASTLPFLPVAPPATAPIAIQNPIIAAQGAAQGALGSGHMPAPGSPSWREPRPHSGSLVHPGTGSNGPQSVLLNQMAPPQAQRAVAPTQGSARGIRGPPGNQQMQTTGASMPLRGPSQPHSARMGGSQAFQSRSLASQPSSGMMSVQNPILVQPGAVPVQNLGAGLPARKIPKHLEAKLLAKQKQQGLLVTSGAPTLANGARPGSSGQLFIRPSIPNAVQPGNPQSPRQAAALRAQSQRQSTLGHVTRQGQGQPFKAAASGQALESLAAARQVSGKTAVQPGNLRPQGIQRAAGVSAGGRPQATQAAAQPAQNGAQGMVMSHAEFQKLSSMQPREGPKFDLLDFTYPVRPTAMQQANPPSLHASQSRPVLGYAQQGLRTAPQTQTPHPGVRPHPQGSNQAQYLLAQGQRGALPAAMARPTSAGQPCNLLPSYPQAVGTGMSMQYNRQPSANPSRQGGSGALNQVPWRGTTYAVPQAANGSLYAGANQQTLRAQPNAVPGNLLGQPLNGVSSGAASQRTPQLAHQTQQRQNLGTPSVGVPLNGSMVYQNQTYAGGNTTQTISQAAPQAGQQQAAAAAQPAIDGQYKTHQNGLRQYALMPQNGKALRGPAQVANGYTQPNASGKAYANVANNIPGQMGPVAAQIPAKPLPCGYAPAPAVGTAQARPNGQSGVAFEKLATGIPGLDTVPEQQAPGTNDHFRGAPGYAQPTIQPTSVQDTAMQDEDSLVYTTSLQQHDDWRIDYGSSLRPANNSLQNWMHLDNG